MIFSELWSKCETYSEYEDNATLLSSKVKKFHVLHYVQMNRIFHINATYSTEPESKASSLFLSLFLFSGFITARGLCYSSLRRISFSAAFLSFTLIVVNNWRHCDSDSKYRMEVDVESPAAVN